MMTTESYDQLLVNVFIRPLIYAALTTVFAICIPQHSSGADPTGPPRAFVDGTEPGWKTLTQGDFKNVNCDENTWQWHDDRLVCTGEPIGVIRTTVELTNFELVTEWQHQRSGGNSGIFVWTAPYALKDLKAGDLPKGGIEVQVLDNGYAEEYAALTGKKPDWFTTHGDVFPVGSAKMMAFHPQSPDGSRSFPRKRLSKGDGEWNHYYIRCINGEVRLWVNGEEVSGGSDCQPAKGYLCLESEGAPILFRNLRIRVLP
jgi:hypothetical protein